MDEWINARMVGGWVGGSNKCVGVWVCGLVRVDMLAVWIDIGD